MSKSDFQDDNFIDEESGSLEAQIKVLRKKVNSFTKWKIIISLYMVGTSALLGFLIYAIYNLLVG
jgi:hypothetical protein